jgi:hypothetical protein
MEQIDPTVAMEILQRLDVLAEAKKYGFVPCGPVDVAGWIPGQCSGLNGLQGLLNIGFGPRRGDFIKCDVEKLGLLPRCSSMN